MALIPLEPLPGVIEFLNYLKKEKKNLLGLVTGNKENIGEKMIRKAGLYSYFSFFSFDRGENREKLVESAINKAEKIAPIKKKIVIGDTVHDIRAGKANSCFTVAVATGFSTMTTLQQEQPHLLLQSLKEYPSILKRISTTLTLSQNPQAERAATASVR